MANAGIGALSSAAFKLKATAWEAAAVVLGAGNGFEYRTENISHEVPYVRDESNIGSAQQGRGERGFERNAGPIVGPAKYEGLEPMLAACFGTAGAPTQLSSSTAYKHQFRIKDRLEGIIGTLGIEKRKDATVWEYESAKIRQIRITGEAGQPVDIEFDFICRTLARNAGSGVNNTTTWDSVTIPANRDKVHFGDLQLLIGAWSDSVPLAATDEAYPSRFELVIDNPMDTEIFTTKGGFTVDEPKRDGHAMCTLSVEFPCYDDETWLNALAADPKTRFMGKLLFDSGQDAGGSNNFAWNFFLGQMEIDEASAQVAGAGVIRQPINFVNTKPSATPSGFDFADQIYMEVVSQLNTDALAT
jgi:hypothetical protein